MKKKACPSFGQESLNEWLKFSPQRVGLGEWAGVHLFSHFRAPQTHRDTLSGYLLANTDTLTVISEHTNSTFIDTINRTHIYTRSGYLLTNIQIPLQWYQNTQQYSYRIPSCKHRYLYSHTRARTHRDTRSGYLHNKHRYLYSYARTKIYTLPVYLPPNTNSTFIDTKNRTHIYTPWGYLLTNIQIPLQWYQSKEGYSFRIPTYKQWYLYSGTSTRTNTCTLARHLLTNTFQWYKLAWIHALHLCKRFPVVSSHLECALINLYKCYASLCLAETS